MKRKEFEKGLKDAAGDRLELMDLLDDVLDDFDEGRSAEQLDALEEALGREVFDRYMSVRFSDRAKEVDEARHRLLTGPGQCRGRLIAYNGEIAVCCCGKMAAALIGSHAQYSRGTITFVSRQPRTSAEHEGATYLAGPDLMVYRANACPFCHARVGEMEVPDAE